jgi:hypothetical protein
MDLARDPRRARSNACKKGSGYEDVIQSYKLRWLFTWLVLIFDGFSTIPPASYPGALVYVIKRTWDLTTKSIKLIHAAHAKAAQAIEQHFIASAILFLSFRYFNIASDYLPG